MRPVGGPWSKPFSYEGYKAAYGGYPPHTFEECVVRCANEEKSSPRPIVKV